MIDLESFNELTPDMRRGVRGAMVTIADSGVIQIQKARNYSRVLVGPADEDPIQLANRIIEFRKSQYGLDAFLEATQLVKDIEDA